MYHYYFVTFGKNFLRFPDSSSTPIMYNNEFLSKLMRRFMVVTLYETRENLRHVALQININEMVIMLRKKMETT